MKRNRLFTAISLVTALLLTACTQDELAEQGNTLPDGEYPLQIGSVSITAEESEEPWAVKSPQTRVAENADGTGSVWKDGDRMGVRIGDNEGTGVYIINVDDTGNITVESETPVYWKSTQPATVTAWYSNIEGSATVLTNTVSLADQSSRLAYVLKGSGTGSHTAAINLAFTHQLAKVRVLPIGTQDVSTITNIYVQGPTSCTVSEGNVTAGTEAGRITMRKATYDGIGTCWEANLPAGVALSKFFIEIGGNVFDCAVTEFTTVAGQIHEAKLKVHSADTEFVDLSTLTETYTINDDTKPYYFSGTGIYGISITGGSPEIYLDNANVSVSSGSAISITGNASPTIHVVGTNNSVSVNSSTYGAGIYVSEASSVAIEGSGTDDVLRVTGGVDGAAIGGYYESGDKSCGDIVIKNVTLQAYAGDDYLLAFAPGIGATGGKCGRIEISSAIVYARSFGDAFYSAPPIGAYSSIPKIVITDSEIHAYRGSFNVTSYADYIGRGGSMFDYQGGQIQYGSGSITGSAVYKYTYNYRTSSSSSEGSETF